MKKIIILLALASLATLGCKNNPSYDNEGERIKHKEERGYYRIIEVDGVEYLSYSNGGLIKLEKKDAQ